MYAFYVCTTIGYGDANVQTPAGRVFVMFYSVIGIWLFGWAADTLTVALQGVIGGVTKRLVRVALRICTACRGRSVSRIREAGEAGEAGQAVAAGATPLSKPTPGYRAASLPTLNAYRT